VTLQTQAGFSLVISALVIGDFFQNRVLQKIPQIGVLKAIGASNLVVAAAAVYQVTLVTITGVLLGRLGTFLLSLGLPPVVPIVFSGPSTLLAVVALMVIGPLGGLVSVRYAVRIEPLRALGLSG
jgi:putative ABC transport system permease protein